MKKPRSEERGFLAPPARLEPNDNVRAQAALTNEVASDLTHNPPSAEMELCHKTKQKKPKQKAGLVTCPLF